MNQQVGALGSVVRATRKSKNISQEALAEKLGVCKRTIIDIEKNTGNPKFGLLCTLVRELDLPLYEVFYPEATENSEMKKVLMKELSDCTDHEMKVILPVVKSLRDSLKNEKTEKDSQWIHFMELLVSAITLTTYCTISPIVAEYQGKKAVYWTAVCAIVLLSVLAVWQLICLIGSDTWEKIYAGLFGVFEKAFACIPEWKQLPRFIYIMPSAVIVGTCVFLGFWQFHTTKYYPSVIEVYGIPTGVGEPLSFEERKLCADYWKIEDYVLRKSMVVTHEDAYHEDEIMGEYSSIYNMAFFQPVDHMVYRYRKNKNKYQKLEDEKAYLTAAENKFREPVEISYFNSGGKLLLEMRKDEERDSFDILTYSIDSMPQLFHSTLLRMPEEKDEEGERIVEIDELISRNAKGDSIRSQSIEVTYNAEGLPETRRIDPSIYNLYGVNGERYVYNENKQMTELYYLDINGEPICNQKGIMMVAFEYGEGDKLSCIRYFGDENREVRTEGFHGVFCEKLEYDLNGNLCVRKQLNQNENRWYDENGVCEYRYSYAEGRLIRETFLDFGGNEAYNEKVKSTWLEFEEEQNDTGNKTLTISLSPVSRFSEPETAVSVKKSEEKGGEGNKQDVVEVMSDNVNKSRTESDIEEEENKKEEAGESKDPAPQREDTGNADAAGNETAKNANANTSSGDIQEETPLRNYTRIRYTINKNEKAVKSSYLDDENNSVQA